MSAPRIALIALSLAMVLSSAQVVAKEKVYEPPYKEGPSGGDQFNHIEADPQTGEMAIYRVFPGISPVVGCEPEPDAGWAMFRIDHRAVAPFKEVLLSFNGRLDPYAWVTLGVRKPSKDWVSVAKFQGPHNGAGELKLRLPRRVTIGSEVEIEFGLQLGDGCPQVSYAEATFESVEVR
ncbi:MAG TPA: hypothetical protein VHJ82_03345 [Actinomycetota bacterium]|nr:hypothetical protein [Actinomycetota bacterium]